LVRDSNQKTGMAGTTLAAYGGSPGHDDALGRCVAGRLD
jgi:hypothetical protein